MSGPVQSGATCGRLYLGLDASDGSAGAALAGDAGVEPLSRFLPAPARPAAVLLTLVDEVLRAARCDVRDLAGVAVAVGPGSYAGVRAAVATGRALAWAARIPLAGVGSLEALAATAVASAAGGSLPGPVVAAALDARRERVYGAVYEAAGGDPRALCAPALWPREQWVAAVAEYARGAGCLLAGPGWEPATVAALRSAIGPSAAWVAVAPAAGAGLAAAVASLGRSRLCAGLTQDPMALLPAYVTEPEIGRPAAGP